MFVVCAFKGGGGGGISEYQGALGGLGKFYFDRAKSSDPGLPGPSPRSAIANNGMVRRHLRKPTGIKLRYEQNFLPYNTANTCVILN